MISIKNYLIALFTTGFFLAGLGDIGFAGPDWPQRSAELVRAVEAYEKVVAEYTAEHIDDLARNRNLPALINAFKKLDDASKLQTNALKALGQAHLRLGVTFRKHLDNLRIATAGRSNIHHHKAMISIQGKMRRNMETRRQTRQKMQRVRELNDKTRALGAKARDRAMRLAPRGLSWANVLAKVGKGAVVLGASLVGKALGALGELFRDNPVAAAGISGLPTIKAQDPLFYDIIEQRSLRLAERALILREQQGELIERNARILALLDPLREELERIEEVNALQHPGATGSGRLRDRIRELEKRLHETGTQLSVISHELNEEIPSGFNDITNELGEVLEALLRVQIERSTLSPMLKDSGEGGLTVSAIEEDMEESIRLYNQKRSDLQRRRMSDNPNGMPSDEDNVMAIDYD